MPSREGQNPNFEDLLKPNVESTRKSPVNKFKKEVKISDTEAEIREFLSVAGIELPVNAEGRGTQFTQSEFEDFALDEKTMELLKIYAKAVKLNQPALVEGPTDIGKSKALEYLAYLTNHHLVYQSFSGQTDVSELIGKYVPNTEDARRTFEKVLSAKNRGTLKENTLKILTGASDRGLTEDECKQISQIEGLHFGNVEWVWQDGTVPRSMEFDGGKGAWLYFDELGAAEPQILVKLNRIFARGVRRIEITENGGKEVEAGEEFRLIATTNPPSYAGREPFEKDFLRRWVYQKVGNLSQEDFLKRLDFTGHGRKKARTAEAPVNLDVSPELDHILNDVVAMFRHSAQALLEKLPRDAGEQEFRLGDFTDALRVQEYLRELQGDDLLETLKEAIEFYYLGKIDDDKKDADNKNVKEKMRDILDTIITQKKVKEKIQEELDKLTNPEIVKQQRAFAEKLKEMEAKEAAVRTKAGLKPGAEKSAEVGGEVSSLTATIREGKDKGKEISFDIAKELKHWSDFYQQSGVDWVTLPETISLTPDQTKEMTRLMEMGFDKLIIIPDNLVGEPEIKGDKISKSADHYDDLHKKMSEGYKNSTWYSDNYKGDGGVGASKDKTTKLRIVLTKDVQNLKDDDLFKQTLGKSVDDLAKPKDGLFTKTHTHGLSESEYLIYQKEYFQKTGKHLDEVDHTWLTESDRPLSGRVAHALWHPGDEQLLFLSFARDSQDDFLGCRLAGSFEVKI